jgi:hypothetical protein
MKYAVVVALGFVSGFLFLPSGSRAQQDAAQPQPQRKDIGALPGHLPKVHYIPSRAADSKYPNWVDASMVLNADGSPNTDLLHPSAVRQIKAFRANATGNSCLPVGHYFQDAIAPPERNTPEQAARNSRLVLFGTVTEKAFGLAGDQPGQLLRVTPDEIIKGQPRNVPAYFVFLPVGTIKIGNLEICKTDEYYPEPPAVGERVLLFVPDSWDWQQNQNDPYLDLMNESGIITIHSDSTVSLPKRFRENLRALPAPSGAEALLSRVRAAAAVTAGN